MESFDFVFRTKTLRPVWSEAHEPIPQYHKAIVRESRQVFEMFQALRNETKEYFFCIHLDTRNFPVCVDMVSVGCLTSSLVHPREVFKSALLSSASAVIMVHNHPSGAPEPSREDHDLTLRLLSAAKILGIRMLDHVIIGDTRWYSFADEGELSTL